MSFFKEISWKTTCGMWAMNSAKVACQHPATETLSELLPPKTNEWNQKIIAHKRYISPLPKGLPFSSFMLVYFRRCIFRFWISCDVGSWPNTKSLKSLFLVTCGPIKGHSPKWINCHLLCLQYDSAWSPVQLQILTLAVATTRPAAAAAAATTTTTTTTTYAITNAPITTAVWVTMSSLTIGQKSSKGISSETACEIDFQLVIHQADMPHASKSHNVFSSHLKSKRFSKCFEWSEEMRYLTTDITESFDSSHSSFSCFEPFGC